MGELSASISSPSTLFPLAILNDQGQLQLISRLGLTASSKLDILSFIHIYSSGCHNIKATWLSSGSIEHFTVFRLHIALYRFSPPLVNLIITCFLPIILWANVAVMDLAHAIGPSYTESCERSDPKEVCS